MIYMENLYFGENICSCYQKGMQPKSTPGNDAIIECIDTKYSIEECGFKNNTCYANIIVRETKPNTEFQRPFESAQEKKKEK